MSPKLLKKQAARQEREARKANTTHEAPRPNQDFFNSLFGRVGLQMLQSYDPATLGNHQVVSLNVFWKNNKDGGFGFKVPSKVLEAKFDEFVQDYFAASDEQHLNNVIENGETVVECYTRQIADYAKSLDLKVGQHRTHNFDQDALLVMHNILWLTSRGLMPNDEFNGVVVAISKLPGTRKQPEGYTPNDVGTHTRTLKSGKVVQVRAYSRGNKVAA